MSSPYATGGGGVHFEARVVASYLAAVLAEAPARGAPGQWVVEVATQRAAFESPLDDIVVAGVSEDGTRPKLYLQIKSDLKFTSGDPEWQATLRMAWETFQNGAFERSRDRLGVAISNYNARVDKHYRSVLSWAANSQDGKYFVDRVEKPDYSHADKRAFLDTIRSALGSLAGAPLSVQDLWQFLRSFVILHFDFASEATSRDTVAVVDRLRNFLPLERRNEAAALWDHLVAKAGELIPMGGGATRETLVRHLSAAGKPTGTAASRWRDLVLLNQESQRALEDVKSDIQGLHLHRRKVYEDVKQALTDESTRFIQIEGEPGTGKSAVLKEIAEEYSRLGPIFVLKDSRIHPRGWSSHAHTLSVGADALTLLREFGTAGAPILFIDGIDKISNPATQLTVNDLIRLIATEESLQGWKVLATVREQNLQHITTWLSPKALSRLPVLSVTLGPLAADELSVVSEYFPRIKPLLLESGVADVILRRPFFLDSILSLSQGKAQEHLPASEAELLKMWWALGGSERQEFSPAQRRREVLLDLADRLSRAPNVPISIRGLDPEPLDNLKSAGVIRDKELGHSVVFAHDIYEEWAFCELLIGKQETFAIFLKEVGEPQALVRPVQLLGSYVLEQGTSEDDWRSLYAAASEETLRPVWARSLLTSCIRTTRSEQILPRLAEYLAIDSWSHLRRLLVALRTIEVVPNPVYLSEKLLPDLGPAERAKVAMTMALPKPLVWIRFLDWFMTQAGFPWPNLIADLLPVFQTWQNAFAGSQVRHCRRIGETASTWLNEFEAARHTDRWEERRNPFGIETDYHDEERIEDSIRSLFLNSAANVPELASAYLLEHGARNYEHIFRDKILSGSIPLAKTVPSNLVDYILKVFLENPAELKQERWDRMEHLADDLGFVDHQAFYPASPAQPPFLVLLREHEAQGLRLVRELCNHAISVWRWANENGRGHRPALTPVPIRIRFPWGVQTFWGDGRVYCWFRALWGNYAVGSALMALEYWALEQIDKGRAFEDVFRTILQGHNSAAALGVAASLCMAYPGNALECALPLVISPRLWKWDIARFTQDATGMPANEIADWHRYGWLLGPVRTLNQKPHRKQDVRALLPYFIFGNDKRLKRKYLGGIRRFAKKLPFDFAEEMSVAEIVTELTETVQLFTEQADPANWKTGSAEDGSVRIWNEAPSLKNEKYAQQNEEHSQLNEYLGLSIWADKSIREESVDARMNLEEGLSKAMDIDSLGLFAYLASAENMIQSQRQNAVVGVACVAARYYYGERWEKEVGPWCARVFQQAATAPEPGERRGLRSSVFSMHPVVFAAWGYSWLLRRGYRIRESQVGLLSLAVDALHAVVAAVASGAKLYASKYPDFYWVLFDLFVSQSIGQLEDIPDHYSLEWDDEEADRKIALLDRAERMLDSGEKPILPDIPLPWVKGRREDDNSETGGFVRNTSVFLWDLAEKTITNAQIDAIVSDEDRRRQFLSLLTQLVAFTIQEIVPPFAKTRRDWDHHTPFEWVFTAFHWLGQVSAQLPAKEAKSAVLDTVLREDEETAMLAMQSYVPAYMIAAFLPPATIREDQVSLWNGIAEWIFAMKEGTELRPHVSREYETCALAILFCVSGGFGPMVCGVEEGWAELGRFAHVIEKAVVRFGANKGLYPIVSLFFKRAGMSLFPVPALSWLSELVASRKNDQDFWRLNGEDTVEILKMVLERKPTLLGADHRKAISTISDIMVDNGVRGAGFLQQEMFRTE